MILDTWESNLAGTHTNPLHRPKALQNVPSPAICSDCIVVQYRYDDKNGQSPTSLSVTTTDRPADADAIRYGPWNSPPAHLGNSYLNSYANSNPSISAEGLPELAAGQD